jgi:hypothetical protein
MNLKIAALALLGGVVCTEYVYAGQQPTVANSYVQSVLCRSQQLVDALQPAEMEGWKQTVTIASFTAKPIGDKGPVCDVHAEIKSVKRHGMAGDIREIDRLILVAVTGEGTIVAEEIDKGFADSLLASKSAQAMATN